MNLRSSNLILTVKFVEPPLLSELCNSICAPDVQLVHCSEQTLLSCGVECPSALKVV